MLRTRLTGFLGIEHPILSAPMASAAAAVPAITTGTAHHTLAPSPDGDSRTSR